MKKLALVCAGLMLVLAADVHAADKQVSKSTLQSIGLGGMQTLSDEEGTQIRGKSDNNFAFARGINTVSFLIISTNGSQIQGFDGNTILAAEDDVGTARAAVAHGSLSAATLATPGFIQTIIGGSGGYGIASSN